MGKGSHNNKKYSGEDSKRTNLVEIKSSSKSNYSYRTDILSDIPKLNTIKIAIPAECI